MRERVLRVLCLLINEINYTVNNNASYPILPKLPLIAEKNKARI